MLTPHIPDPDADAVDWPNVGPALIQALGRIIVISRAEPSRFFLGRICDIAHDALALAAGDTP